MCYHPVRIKNPNFNRITYASERGCAVEIDRHLVCTSEFIEVPCGKCAECRNSYYNSLLQRALVEAHTSYMYFLTLTYDNNHIPSIVLPTGEIIYYSDYSDIQLLFKRVRNLNILDRDFRYMCVTEYGDTNSRPHFHILLFVAHRDDDTSNTPYFIERVLYDNIKKLFSRNIGTRKNPTYEPLFTFRQKYTTRGLMSNYFVKYVCPSFDADFLDELSTPEEIYIKTIRYLIGYINKGSAFDNTIENILTSYEGDTLLCSRLKNLLRSKVRFSKGFGCGFIDGHKHYIPRISVRSSLNSIVYTDLMQSLPDTFGEFYDNYPTMVESLVDYISRCIYAKYQSLRECMLDMSTDDFMNHCLILKYFPNYFSMLYSRYFRPSLLSNPKVSYFFAQGHYKYKKPKVLTTSHEASPTWDYLRRGVEEGISHGVPYLSFKISSEFQFTSLCRYFRERVCTLEDTIAMFRSCRVNNYDEWMALFTQQLDLRKANLSRANLFTHSSTEKIIWKYQKNCLPCSRVLKGIDLYKTLLTDCNR